MAARLMGLGLALASLTQGTPAGYRFHPATEVAGNKRHEVPLRGLKSQSAKADFVPFVARDFSRRVEAVAGAALLVASPHAASPISGRVLDARGKPVPGAKVSLILHRPNSAGGYRHVRSGPDGAFAFPAPGEGTEFGIGLLAFTERSGFGSHAISATGSRTGVTLRLEDASGQIVGRVTDRSGRPLAGVTARLLQVSVDGRWVWFPEELDAPRAVTDARGRYRIRGLPNGAQISLRFLHSRYARHESWRQWRNVIARPSGPEVAPVRLRDAARIVGRVLHAGSGKPVPGARVHAWLDASPDAEYAASADAVPDAAGRFRFDQLPPGRYRVSLQNGTHAGGWVARSRRVEHLAEGKSATCEPLRLVRGGVATGIVTDRDTGAPVEGANVMSNLTGPGGWEQGPSATSGKEGRFRLRLPPGAWSLQVQHFRYVDLWQEGEQGTAVTIVEGGTAPETRHTLLAWASLIVRVVTPDGRPDLRAKVIVPMGGEQRVGSDGTLALERLKPDTTATLVAIGGDRSLKALLETPIRKGANEPVTLRLARCLPATGRVQDGQGRPLVGVEVEAQRRINITDQSWTHAKIDSVKSGADGRFTLWLLPGQEHQIMTSREGYGRVQKEGVTPRAAQHDLGALTLRRADRAIAGHVSNIYGEPIAGVRVSSHSQTQPEFRQAVTDDQGRYRITGLAAGRVNVNLEHPSVGYESRDNVAAGATGVDFVLAPREESRPRTALKTGDRAPALAAARWLNGGDAKLFKGRLLIVQFATPYNAAVEASAARLNDLHRRFARRGVSVVALYDASLPPTELAAYVKARGLTYPIGVVAPRHLGWTSEPFRRWGVYAVPSLYVVDRKGVVRAVDPTPTALEQEVRRLVVERP